MCPIRLLRTGSIQGFYAEFDWSDALRRVPNVWDDTEVVPPDDGFATIDPIPSFSWMNNALASCWRKLFGGYAKVWNWSKGD
jgi:hypothetical protein